MNQDYDFVLTDSGRAIASCIYEKHCYFKDIIDRRGLFPATATGETPPWHPVSVKKSLKIPLKNISIRAH